MKIVGRCSLCNCTKFYDKIQPTPDDEWAEPSDYCVCGHKITRHVIEDVPDRAKS